MSLNVILFWLIALTTSGCAVAVVVSQNIVRMAAWLLFALGGTACVFFLLHADFVGATQLLVYVGGTLVLVVFGVMLTAQGPFLSMKTSAAEWVISTVVGLMLFAVLAGSLVTANWATNKKDDAVDLAQTSDTVQAGKGFTGFGVGPEHVDPNPEPPKKMVRVAYLLPFEIVSVHLLVVLVGAAYLARAKRRQVRA